MDELLVMSVGEFVFFVLAAVIGVGAAVFLVGFAYGRRVGLTYAQDQQPVSGPPERLEPEGLQPLTRRQADDLAQFRRQLEDELADPDWPGWACPHTPGRVFHEMTKGSEAAMNSVRPEKTARGNTERLGGLARLLRMVVHRSTGRWSL